MDMWIVPLCFGVLNLIPGLYCTIFQAQSNVVWTEADAECRKSNGILYKPDERSFDVSPFPNNTFDGDSWVAASYIFVTDPESHFTNFRPNNSFRCIAVEIQENCVIRYWGRACTERYGMIFELRGNLQLLHGNEMDWKAATNVCQTNHGRLATFINRQMLASRNLCIYGFYWTGVVIQVMFQSIRPNHGWINCGILKNDVLSFDNCFRTLRPLCERADRSTTRSPNSYHRTGTNVTLSVLKSSTTTYNTTKAVTTDIVLANTTIDQVAIFEITSRRSSTNNGVTGGVKEENIYASLPPAINMEKGSVASSSSNGKSITPDIGLIIGSVLGSIVFLLLMVLLVIILLKRLKPGPGKSDSTNQAERTKWTTRNNTMNPAFSVYDQDFVLQAGLNNETYVSYASHPEQRNQGITAEISKTNTSIFSLAASDATFANYAKVKKSKTVLKACNDSTNVLHEVNVLKEMGSGSATGNIYDKTNFRLIDGLASQSDSNYDTTNEFRKALGQSDGVYDKASSGNFGEYDTTYVTRKDTEFTYNHV